MFYPSLYSMLVNFILSCLCDTHGGSTFLSLPGRRFKDRAWNKKKIAKYLIKECLKINHPLWRQWWNSHIILGLTELFNIWWIWFSLHSLCDSRDVLPVYYMSLTVNIILVRGRSRRNNRSHYFILICLNSPSLFRLFMWHHLYPGAWCKWHHFRPTPQRKSLMAVTKRREKLSFSHQCEMLYKWVKSVENVLGLLWTRFITVKLINGFCSRPWVAKRLARGPRWGSKFDWWGQLSNGWM